MSQSSREFMLLIAGQIGKSAQEIEKFITILEENFIDTAEALRDITDEQWRNDLKFPVGLVNKIKKQLTQGDSEMEPTTKIVAAPTQAMP